MYVFQPLWNTQNCSFPLPTPLLACCIRHSVSNSSLRSSMEKMSLIFQNGGQCQNEKQTRNKQEFKKF